MDWLDLDTADLTLTDATPDGLLGRLADAGAFDGSGGGAADGESEDADGEC